MIKINKSYSKKDEHKIYFCGFNLEEYFIFTIYVAKRDSIKKNNKLPKVDRDISINVT